MKIIATPIKGKDLQPGDLFSTRGAEYWGDYQSRESIGERACIRTGTLAIDADDAEETIYRLEIVREEGV